MAPVCFVRKDETRLEFFKIKAVTNLMINHYQLKKTKCDFMGYKLQRDSLRGYSKSPITFHHLIVPKRKCAEQRIPEHGYVEWNGALLMRYSHDYLHQIEMYDREMFERLTTCMIYMNQNGKLDKNTLLAIRDILEEFEEKYPDLRTKNGHKVIKPEYKTLRLTRQEIIDSKTIGY